VTATRPLSSQKPKTQPANSGAGILPDGALKALIESRAIAAEGGVDLAQVQPASLDLRLGERAYRIRASFLAGVERTVEEKLAALVMHEMDLAQGAVLETGCVYLVPLKERLALPPDIAGIANPKSSTGRLDVFTRLITDRGEAFDRVAPGYVGPLYAEISPRSFSILVRAGSRLNQMRFRRARALLDDAALKALHEQVRLVDGEADIEGGIALRTDLAGDAVTRLVGFRAKRHVGLVDVDRVAAYDPLDYWEPLFARNARTLILDPHEFYILASKEAVQVPPTHAAEMVPFNPLVGEFRVHYAGFFDPGFGHAGAGGQGARAVLEVRSHEVPFILEDRQIVGRLVYERLAGAPSVLYGQTIGSSYQRQGLALSKHFRRT
jgi:dCTP deaminase